MPWSTPTLAELRKIARDRVTSVLPKAALIGNAALRVMSDTNASLAHLCLLYEDWCAKQYLPDTAEEEWLERHAKIWLTNADGSTGRKAPTPASGSATFTGINGTPLPKATQLSGQGVDADGNYSEITFETTEQIVIGTEATPCNILAIDAGSAGNIQADETLTLVDTIAGVDSAATVVELSGGTDQESIDEMRTRVLLRIREPPMGGDKTDYIEWALAYPGVTRAWSYPKEMGIGTCTVRFMMDELRAADGGFPSPVDVAAVQAFLDAKRPVAVKDFFLEAPIPYSINFSISGLDVDDESTRAAIEETVRAMFLARVEPGLTLYRSWLDEAISGAVGEDHHELTFQTTAMPAPGYMAILGTITYG